MPPLTRLLFAAAPLMCFAAETGAPSGGAPSIQTFSQRLTENGTKKMSLHDQFTAAEDHIANLEGQLATVTAERDELSGLKDGPNGQLLTALRKERDEAVALAKNPSEQALKIMSDNPSGAARMILAQAGGPPVSMRPSGNIHPGETGKVAAGNLAGKSPLSRAVAKSQAGGFNKQT